ncbi:MAG: helix-turn-helix transcriptional regulator [Bacilli bacterium]|nr:helix-turn-helix transcriptional regulator [Bacilli bacterium]
MAKESFGTRLAGLRKQKGLTQSDIADRLNVTAQAVSKWENDLASPDIDMLMDLADIFDISVDELLGRGTPVVEVQDKPSKKDIDKMVLKIRVLDAEDGDTVNVNLPLALVRAFVKTDGTIPLLAGKKEFDGIDFNKIIELVECGLVGELVSVNGKDGDKVSIFVE